MARKASSTAVQEELYPVPRDAERDAREREPFDDARLINLEAEQESPFLRGQKRVSARRGAIPKKAAISLKWAGLALVIVGLLAVTGAALYRYGNRSWRFRIDSSDQIEVLGAQHVPHAQIMDVMGGDIGRNIFFVPLALRKQQLEQIPWVESASVMRFVPNRLRIEIHERTPVAFARIGSHISLIDAGGNLMDLAPGGKHKYSFPVISGMNASEPVSTRAARMKNYNELIGQLDSGGAHYSQDLSEVDLADPDDVKVVTADSSGGVLVHLGNANYLQRYKIYVTHVEVWRQQFEKLESVDLRFDGQIIVNPDLQGLARQPALTPSAAKAAVAAGVKNAAIVNYEKFVNHPAPTSVNKPGQPKKAGAKTAVKGAAKNSSLPANRKATPRVNSNANAAKNSAAHPSPAASSNMTPKTAIVPAAPLPIAQSPAAVSAPKPAPQAALAPASAKNNQKKPSPVVAKESPQN
ncbi:MAG: FtsQ-type POTRA domain-containing protein [Terriglobales bacterium]